MPCIQLISSIILLLISLPVALNATWKAHKEISRSETLLNIGGDTSEERLHLEHCSQSSDLDACTLAIDDDINQRPDSTECAVTKAEPRPWFKARLENPAFVTKVIIHTLMQISDRGQDALKDFQLNLGDRVCINYRSDRSFLNKTFSCDDFTDFIQIQSNTQYDSVLALCEVEVYGKMVKLDRGLVDEDQRLNGKPIEILDCSGKFNCRMPFTQSGVCYTHPTNNYEVKFQPAVIRWVFLTNANMNSYEIFVNGQLCAKYDKPAAQAGKAKFFCNRFGKTLRITSIRPKDTLTLCRIQLIGFPMVIVKPPTTKYVGCFREKIHNRDLQRLAAVNHMSRNKCARICRRHKKPYFGLQQGRQCWCSERYGTYGRVGEEACWMRCEIDEPNGEKTQCGAPTANSVYELEEYTGSDA